MEPRFVDKLVQFLKDELGAEAPEHLVGLRLKLRGSQDWQPRLEWEVQSQRALGEIPPTQSSLIAEIPESKQVRAHLARSLQDTSALRRLLMLAEKQERLQAQKRKSPS